MTCIGLGKVTVTTSGTPILLSSVTSQQKVHKILVSFDPADGSSEYVYVKDSGGNIYAGLSLTGSPVVIGGDPGNQLDTTKFKIDSSANGKGPIVGIDVE